MINMGRVVHFDIYADDPKRASEFYEKTFGWKFEKWKGAGMDYWLIMTGSGKEPGIDGGMAKREKGRTDSVSTNAITIGVPALDAAIEKVEQFGGKILMPKMAIPGVGWFATFQDMEGNVLGMIQMDASAK